MECSSYPLRPEKIVATATDTYLTPSVPFPDGVYLPAGTPSPRYGQDIASSTGRAAPGGKNVGTTPAVLEPKMRKLLSIFAAGDRSGMAKRLFDSFLKKSSVVAYFDDAALNTAAAGHSHIQYFCSCALSAPNSPHRTSGKKRIHQALRDAGWDIHRIVAPTDLGVPAFNEGSKVWKTGDFDNGLGLMINGVQYAYVIATNYNYSSKANEYCITLRYVFYDVFGLDDDDLHEFGASSDAFYSSNASIGITAWWQLQHQHGYAPLVTRIVHEQTWTAPAI